MSTDSIVQGGPPRSGVQQLARLRAREGFAIESRALVRLALPLIFSQLGAVAMTTMDTLMVGPLGAGALAAVGLGSALHMALLVVATGLLFGMGPLVSQAFGAGDLEGCRRVLVQGIVLALLVALPMTWINLYGERIALALGQDPAIAHLVGGYMGALAWGVPPLFLFVAFRQYLEGMSLTRPAMVITFLAVGFNFVGNRLFIHGAEGWLAPMGAVGSGWATTLVRWIMLGGMLLYLALHPRLRPFAGMHRSVEAKLLRRMVRIGVPTGIQVGLEVGLFTFAAVMMGWFGATELASHQVTLNIASTTFMVALGISLAGSIRVGQALGAGDRPGARRVVLLTYALALGAMACFALLFLLAPRFLLSLYTDDPAVLQLGASLLFMAALFQLFDGAQVAGFSVLRGAADTRVPMLIAGAGYWGVGAPAGYLLAFHTSLGPVGIWAGLVAGLIAATFLLAWRVRIIHWAGARHG